MSNWDRAASRQAFGERREPSLLQLALTAYLVMSVLVTVVLWRAAAPADVIDPTYPAFVAQLAPGQTLWDLAGVYAPGYDRRMWIERVKQINGWAHIPNLRAGESFVAVMWTAPEEVGR